tara:strand:+ start:2808 stop:2993 length:186 start_codon:yes stop_codon:yes gene_type:complete
MEQTELLRELREIIGKLEGGVNMLTQGKHILAHRRLVGVGDKLVNLLKSLDLPKEKQSEDN